MSRSTRAILAAALGAALLPVSRIPVPAQQPPLPPKATVAQQVDSLVGARLAHPRGPASVSVMIVRSGDTLVHQAWGTADAATNRPATVASTYQLASTSKQFTAALVLKLVDRGKLSLSDSIGRYLASSGRATASARSRRFADRVTQHLAGRRVPTPRWPRSSVRRATAPPSTAPRRGSAEGSRSRTDTARL